MPTNLALDDKLIVAAQKIGRFKTKRDAVTEALKEYISRRKQRGIAKFFGTVNFDPRYDYKAHRARP